MSPKEIEIIRALVGALPSCGGPIPSLGGRISEETCGKPATYFRPPGYADEDLPFCDDHVPDRYRGSRFMQLDHADELRAVTRMIDEHDAALVAREREFLQADIGQIRHFLKTMPENYVTERLGFEERLREQEETLAEFDQLHPPVFETP